MLIDIHTHFPSETNFSIYNSFIEKTSIDCSYGIHPWYIPLDYQTVFIQLGELIQQSNCLAIGECGLDKNSEIDWETQFIVFKKHIQLSEKHKKPMIIHCVKAIQELILLKRELKPTQPWIFHGFRKTNTTNQLLKEGFYLSIGTSLLYDSKLQEVVKLIPLNRIFLETDDKNDVSIKEVYLKLSQILNLDFKTLELQIEKNFQNVFNREISD